MGGLIKDAHIKAVEGNSRTLIVSTLMDITGRSWLSQEVIKSNCFLFDFLSEICNTCKDGKK